MKTIREELDEFVLSRFPKKMTVGQLQTLLTNDNPTSQRKIREYIYDRLHYRYIEPLLNVFPRDKKSGFLMMASASLLIETLQSFYTGQDDTNTNAPGGIGKISGRKSFEKFFEDQSSFFQDSPIKKSIFTPISDAAFFIKERRKADIAS